MKRNHPIYILNLLNLFRVEVVNPSNWEKT